MAMTLQRADLIPTKEQTETSLLHFVLLTHDTAPPAESFGSAKVVSAVSFFHPRAQPRRLSGGTSFGVFIFSQKACRALWTVIPMTPTPSD